MELRNERRNGDRRKGQDNFIFIERRDGFSRRLSDNSNFAKFLNSIRNNVFAYLGILIAINLLNIADYIYTVNAISKGAIEANPVLQIFFTVNNQIAGVYKILMVLFISLIAWKFRKYKSIIATNLLILLVLSFVLIYHFYGLTIV